MSELSIHRVEKIEIVGTKELTSESGVKFYNLDIEITNSEGTFTIVLYSDDPNSLELKLS